MVTVGCILWVVLTTLFLLSPTLMAIVHSGAMYAYIIIILAFPVSVWLGSLDYLHWVRSERARIRAAHMTEVRRTRRGRRPPREFGNGCWLPLLDITADEAKYLRKRYGGRITRKNFLFLVMIYGLSPYAHYFEVKNGHATWKGQPSSWDYFLFLGAPNTIIDVASSVNAPTFGLTEAANVFRRDLDGALKVNYSVTKAVELQIQDAVDFPVTFVGGGAVASDHIVLAILRSITRQVYERVCQIKTTYVPTLVIGSAMREINFYFESTHVDHYIAGVDSKDYSRSLVPLLSAIAKASRIPKLGRARQVALNNLKQVLDMLKRLGELPTNVVTSLADLPRRYERLVFEDSAYNFGPSDWHRIFKETGANSAVIYGFYPDELAFPSCVPSEDYDYRYNAVTDMATVGYRYGVSNGYTHRRSTWAAFIDEPVMNFPDFSVVFEVKSRVGPYWVVEAVKVVGAVSPEVRKLGMRASREFVQVLDYSSSYRVAGKILKSVYFPVLAREWFAAVNTVLSWDPKMATFANVQSWVKRQSGGVSVATREIVKPWALKPRDYRAFSLAVLIYALAEQGKIDQILWETGSAPATWGSVLFGVLRMSGPQTWISDFSAKVVLYPANAVDTTQYATVPRSGQATFTTTMGEYEPDNSHTCEYCAEYEAKKWPGDKQRIRCTPGEDFVDYSMTASEATELFSKLADDDEDAAGLARVKAKAKELVPLTGFSRVTKTCYLRGGPGTGKSTTIRMLATSADAVYAPFSKLMSDYTYIYDAAGNPTKQRLRFATTHRGFSLGMVDTLFVDEVSAVDWDMLRCVVHLTNARRVFFVGDFAQTNLREGAEGHSIRVHANGGQVENISKHELMVNFRNPADTVNLLNRLGYEMQAMSHRETSIEVCGPGTVMLPDEIPMVFTYDTANQFGLAISDKVTVRTNQGSTHAKVFLPIKRTDLDVADAEGMAIVAVSRHTTSLRIVHDGTAGVLDWLMDNLSIGPTGYNFDPEKTYAYTEKSFSKIADSSSLINKVEGAMEYSVVAETVALPSVGLDLSKRELLAIGVLVSWIGTFFGFLLPSNVLFLMALTALTGATVKDVVNKPSRLVRVIGPFLAFYVSSPWVAFALWRAPPFLTKMLVTERVPQPLIGWAVWFFFPDWVAPILDQFVAVVDQLRSLVVGNLLRWASIAGFAWIQVPASLTSHIVDVAFIGDHLLALGSRGVVVVPLFFYMRYIAAHDAPWITLRLKAVDVATPSLAAMLNAHAPSLEFSCGNYVETSEVLVKASFRAVRMSLGYVAHAYTYLTGYEQGYVIFSVDDIEAGVPLVRLPCPRDAGFMSDEGLPSRFFEGSMATNAWGSLMTAQDAAKSMVVRTVDLFDPRNARGHAKIVSNAAYRWCNGVGHTFGSVQPGQMLSVLTHRVLGKQRTKVSTPAEREACAKRMVNRFVAEHMVPVVWHEAIIERVVAEAEQAAREKKYEGQLRDETSPDFRVIRGHLKSIFKPSPKKDLDVLKPGQLISAWSKDAQVLFGTAIRVINAHFSESLRDHAIYDNRMSQEHLFRRLKTLLPRIPASAKNGVTDFTMFDCQQDDFTQAIEREFLRAMGVSDDFIAHYYSMRSQYPVLSNVATGRAGTQKTSGEPGTLLFNSVLNVVVTNALLRGEGPAVICVKGDDGYKRQANLKIDTAMYDEMRRFTHMDIKLSFDDPAEFCGNIVGQGTLAPNLARKLTSIQGRSFKSYDDFSLYQISLRQFLRELRRDDDTLNEVIALNGDVFCSDLNPSVRFHNAERILHELESISHWDRPTFHAKFQPYSEGFQFIGAHGRQSEDWAIVD